MPFSRPLLTDLQAQAQADISSQIVGGDSLLRRSILRILAWSQAGLAHGHYGFLDYIARQSNPATATGSFMYAWGLLKGVTPKYAAASTGSVQFSGANGSPLSAGTSVTRSDSAAFVTTSSGTVSGGFVTVSLQAVVAGASGNCDTGTTFTISGTVTGVNATGAATTVFAGGADPETDDAYRTRMLAKYRAPPQGGSVVDYVQWATAVPGVTRAWVAPNAAGAGTVSVYTMWDVAEASHSGFPQGTNGAATGETRAAPATGDQLAVANAVFIPQPVTALVYSMAPTAYPVNFTIADLDPPTAPIKAAISVALAAVFLRNAAPGGTAWPISVAGVPNGKMYQSEFVTAIASVAGVNRFTLTSPSSSITAGTGAIPTLGSVTYV